MEIVSYLSLFHNSEEKRIELVVGDVIEVAATNPVDLLVISAFPGDYEPTRGSMVGQLKNRGISVADLAANKAYDLTAAFASWMSHDLTVDIPNSPFRRILCFEPLIRGNPPEVVGDLFQGLMPFVHGNPPIKSVIMPILATGDQHTPVEEMTNPLITAAARWMSLGLPIDTLKIVVRTEEKAQVAAKVMESLRGELVPTTPPVLSNAKKYDIFISYSHKDTEPVDLFSKHLLKTRPNIRIFLDRMELRPGAAWQQEIFVALDNCRKVIAVYSPNYLSSKVCKEEFNIALFRHRDADDGVLMPILLRSANLPTFMKMIQYQDCREADPEKLRLAGEVIGSAV